MSWESLSRNPPEPENEGEKGHGSCVANPSPEGRLTSSNLSPVAEVEVELHSGNDMSNPNSSKADRRPPTDADFPKVERRTKMRLDRSVSLKPPLPPREKAAASSSKSNLSSPVEILRDKPPFEIPVPRPRNPLREGFALINVATDDSECRCLLTKAAQGPKSKVAPTAVVVGIAAGSRPMHFKRFVGVLQGWGKPDEELGFADCVGKKENLQTGTDEAATDSKELKLKTKCVTVW
ncbi:hypothetical protein SASPL_109698 [Salvia splendens]|uniref:Uncharacterized protein n=1 Tax=Salvia splendens TaxID=180675 RepID=A0A8X8YHM4_SALSN|nr:hypothetical protein SASPL_109698 [Salvia splendens]